MRPSWTDVASLALLLGFGAVLAKGWPWSHRQDFWQAAAAVSTFLAVCVSLFYSNQAARRSRQLEKDTGRVIAARVSVSIRGWLALVKSANKEIRNARDLYFKDADAARESIDRVRSAVFEFSFEVSDTDLIGLSKIDPDLAESVALALGCVDRLKDNYLWSDLNENLLPVVKNFKTIGGYLFTTQLFLFEIQKKCQGMRTINLRTTKQWKEFSTGSQ